MGDEEAHIEFLVDAEAGTVTAWFFKPHMEQYLRIKAESFAVLAKLPAAPRAAVEAAIAKAMSDRPDDVTKVSAPLSFSHVDADR